MKLEDAPALKLGEYPSAPGDPLKETYKDDIFVGYRYYDTYRVKPQYAFGHGLSYTTFKYSPLQVTPGNQSATVKLTVTNSRQNRRRRSRAALRARRQVRRQASREGAEGFRESSAEARRVQTVTLTLDKTAFQYYDEAKKQWVLEPGKFEVLVGSASDDIRQKADLTL